MLKSLLVFGLLAFAVMGSAREKELRNCSVGQVSAGEIGMPGLSMVLSCDAPNLSQAMTVCRDAVVEFAPIVEISRVSKTKIERVWVRETRVTEEAPENIKIVSCIEGGRI